VARSAPARRGGGGQLRKIKLHEEKDAEMYVRSLFEPFVYRNVHRPEAIGLPSTTAFLQSNHTISMVTLSDGNFLGMMYIKPNLQQMTEVANAGTAVGNITGWTTGNSPYVTSLGTNGMLYRVVSMGVRVVNYGALLNRGMMMTVGMYPYPDMTNFEFSGDPAATAYSNLLNSDYCTVYDSANLPADGFEMSWLPITLDTALKVDPGDTHTAVTAVAYRDPVAVHEVFDNAIAIAFYAPSTSSYSDLINVQVGMNIEWVPIPSQTAYHDLGYTPGSRDDISIQMSRVDQQLESKGSSVADMVRTGVRTLGHELSSQLGEFLFGGAKSWQQTVRKGIAGLTSLPGFMNHPRYRIIKSMACECPRAFEVLVACVAEKRVPTVDEYNFIVATVIEEDYVDLSRSTLQLACSLRKNRK
jgi:hypothetical protein